MEIDQTTPDWMITLAKHARTADEIILRNFEARPADVSFVQRICLEQNLSVQLWTDDALKLEKC